MKLFYVAAIACTALITGCVISETRNDLRKDITPVEYNSVKSSKVLALCVSDEWDKIDNVLMRVQMRQTTNGYSVWVEQSVGSPMVGFGSMKDSATFLADIDDTQSGSITHYYAPFTYKKDWVSALEKCLNDASVKSIATPENPILKSSPANSSASQKLRELQGLRKDGLITEDEFQNKKKQLLDKL
jgi:hypothetical protein